MTAAKIQNRLTGIVVRQQSQQIGRGRNTGAVNIAGDMQTFAPTRSIGDDILAAAVGEMELIQSEAAVKRVVAGAANQCVPAGTAGQDIIVAIPIQPVGATAAQKQVVILPALKAVVASIAV